jgi:hypothetical protein
MFNGGREPAIIIADRRRSTSTGFKRHSSNPALSANAAFNITKATATITLSSFAQTYSGDPKVITAFTTPNAILLSAAYSQKGVPVAVPISVGSYDVLVTITDPNYSGTKSGVMVISSAVAWRRC